MLTMNYMGTCFQMLTFERGWKFSSSMHHFVFIYVILAFIFFRFSGITKKAAKLEAKLKEKAEGKAKEDTKKSQ